MARATSSLPVPLSPVISTDASDLATFLISGIDVLHCRAAADHALESPSSPGGLAEPLPLEVGDVEGPLDHDPQLVHDNGLEENIIGALLRPRGSRAPSRPCP